MNIEKNIIDHVESIIRNISFRGGKSTQCFKSPELDVVQDADRLDALGAIGIARTFNFGGYKGREIFNPDIKPKTDMSRCEYVNISSPSLNHFYEKLLLLKDTMNTETGRLMAIKRHDFMLRYLDQFNLEWQECCGE